METDSEHIEKIVHQNFSADLYMDQKKKISEILHYHDTKNTNQSSSEPALVINPKSKQKSKTPKKNQISHSKDQSIDDSYNLKDLTLSLDDDEAWEFSTFDYENIDSEDLPITTSPATSYSEFKSSHENTPDLRNVVLKSTCLFNLSR